jgi:hypothetical protein
MSIPFEISDVHAGFSEAKGLIHVEDDFLVFNVQTITMGMFKQSPETIKIELAALSDIRLEKKIFRDRLYIRPKTNKLLDVIPGKHLGEIMVKVWRKHRPASMSMVDDIQYNIRKRRRATDEPYD